MMMMMMAIFVYEAHIAVFFINEMTLENYIAFLNST